MCFKYSEQCMYLSVPCLSGLCVSLRCTVYQVSPDLAFFDSSFRWVKDHEAFGEELKGSGSLRAEGEEPIESYQGSYRCYASNILGTAMTQVVQIIVECESLTSLHSLTHTLTHGQPRHGGTDIKSCSNTQLVKHVHVHIHPKLYSHMHYITCRHHEDVMTNDVH